MQLVTYEEALQIDCTAAASGRQVPVLCKQSARKPVETDPSNPLGNLSRREQEVLTLFLAGKSNKTIAHELCLSQKTTDTYKSALKKKLCISNNVDLVRFGIRHGLLEA